MARATTKTCASCREFPLAASMKTQGRAQCGAFERPANWNDVACVLYMPASNLDERRRMVEQLRAQEKQKSGVQHENE
jgi:hypothetical protein